MIKYSIVDKLLIKNWIESNPSRDGKVFGLFSFESDSLEDLYIATEERDKKKSKQIIDSYRSEESKNKNINDFIKMLDNAKCIVKYEKRFTDEYGRTDIKILEIINHHNEYLDKYLILV